MSPRVIVGVALFASYWVRLAWRQHHGRPFSRLDVWLGVAAAVVIVALIR